MKPEYEPKSQEQAIAHLIEECNEVGAAAAKALRFGLDSYNPELPPEERETNRDWITREVADLVFAIANYQRWCVARETKDE